MSFNVSVRNVEGVMVLDLSGKLIIGEPVAKMRKEVMAQVDNGERKFILNMADVSYVDSSGLGALVWIHVSVRNKGGSITLVNLTSKSKDLLQMTKLLTVFNTYDSESRAIAALTGWPSGR